MSELKRIYEGLHTVAEASEGPYKPALWAWVTKLSDMLPNRGAVLHVNGIGYGGFHDRSTNLIRFDVGRVRLDGTFTPEQLLAIYEHLKEKS